MAILGLSPVELLVAFVSTITRLSTWCFLRWIPGHHFPPVIIASLCLYLTLIYLYLPTFGSTRPSLHEAFPSLFKHRDEHQHDEKDDKSIILKLIDHEPVLYQDEVNVFKIFVLGIPRWQELEFSYLTIGFNMILALLSLDLVFRAPLLHTETDLSFSRVGFVDHSSARILLRDPTVAHLPIYTYIKPSLSSEWAQAGTIYNLDDDTDFTRSVSFGNLVSSTSYDYYFSNDLNGTFTTADPPNTNSLTFMTTSCIKANFPYRLTSHSLAIHGFEYMSKVLSSLTSRVSFMLFLGDFIYVDVPLRLSSNIEHYRSEYRRVYASPSWNLPGMAIPWLNTIDDHEIANDWAGGNKTEPFPAASDPWIHYHHALNPPIPSTAPDGPNTTYYQFTQGPASFFMLDTRRYRTSPEKTDNGLFGGKPGYGSSEARNEPQEYGPSMLGPQQLHSLLAFLRAEVPLNVRFKIVTSSVPFTKNWRFGFKDSWAGYLAERKIVLDAMHEAEQRLGVRVVVLSGDRHEFGAVRFSPAKPNTTSIAVDKDSDILLGVHEFSVSPLSMFYLPIPTFRQIDEEDVVLKYHPKGNSKFGIIDITPSRDLSGSSIFTYSLYVDGEESWTYNITSPAPGWERQTNLETWPKLWS